MKRILALLALVFALLFLVPIAKAEAFQKGDRVKIPFRCAQADIAFFIADARALNLADFSLSLFSESLSEGICIPTQNPCSSSFILAQRISAFGMNDGFVWGIAHEKGGEIVGYIGLSKHATPFKGKCT